MSGGPSGEQRAAAASQAKLNEQSAKNSDRMMDRVDKEYDLIQPFAVSRMNGGLPFNNSLTDYAHGQNAAAFAPAFANLNRNLAGFGALPSGFATQARTDLEAQRARFRREPRPERYGKRDLEAERGRSLGGSAGSS